MCLRRDNRSLFLRCDAKPQIFLFFREGLALTYATKVMLSSTWTCDGGPAHGTLAAKAHCILTLSHGKVVSFSVFPFFFFFPVFHQNPYHLTLGEIFKVHGKLQI